jgi:hypothetical protein
MRRRSVPGTLGGKQSEECVPPPPPEVRNFSCPGIFGVVGPTGLFPDSAASPRSCLHAMQYAKSSSRAMRQIAARRNTLLAAP